MSLSAPLLHRWRSFANSLLTVRHPDEIVVRRGKAVLIAAYGLLAIVLLAFPIVLWQPKAGPSALANIIAALIVYSGVAVAVRRGRVVAAAIVFNVMNALGPVVSVVSGGMSSSAFYLSFVVLLAAATLPPWVVLLTGTGTVSLTAALYLQAPDGAGRELLGAALLVLVLTSVIAYILAVTTESSIRRLQGALGDLARANDDLAQLNATLEQRVEDRTTDLRSAEQRRRDTMRRVGHDMNNALMEIMGDVAVIEQLVPAEAAADLQTYLSTLNETVEGLGAATANLMDSALAETGDVPLRPVPVDLTDLTASILRGRRGTFSRLKLEAHLVADGPAVVMVDPNRMGRVLQNIIGNSAKFTPEGGRIVVRVISTDDRVVWTCQDTGCGVDPAKLHLLGQQMLQLRDPQAPNAPRGTGLGLHASVQIVQASGGTVEFASPGLGQGTTVTLTLPAARHTLPQEDYESVAA